MTNSFSRTAFAKAAGLFCIFALGVVTHWGYSISGHTGASWTIFAGHSGRALSASEGAKSRADPALRALALSIAPPAAPVIAVDPVLPSGDRAIQLAVGRMADVAAPVPLDLQGLAMAAMRTQLLQTELTLRALQARFERKLAKEKARALAVAERTIDQAATVTAPDEPLLAAIAASIVRQAQPFAQMQGADAAKTIQVASINPKAGPVSGAAPGSGLRAIAVATKGDTPSRPQDPAGKIVAYAPLPDAPAGPPEKPSEPEEAHDLGGVREAILAYRKGEMESGDSHAKRARGDIARIALEWAALSLQPRKVGFGRIVAFIDRYPQWPRRGWLQAHAEQRLFLDPAVRGKMLAYFSHHKAISPMGKLAHARLFRDQGKKSEAEKLVRTVWREERFNNWLEKLIVKEFGQYLSADDHKHRADRHFYRERYTDSLRTAGKAGKDTYAFAAARVVVARGAAPEKHAGKFPAKFQRDPTWTFAQIHRLRKAEKPQAAAKLLLESKIVSQDAVNSAAWWSEQRMIARRLLDAGDAQTAYKVSAAHFADTGASLLDAEFYAGWIALRFLNKPDAALGHFAHSLRNSTTPISRSRAAYWQARAAELGAEPEDAERLYAVAADHSSTYYGQLANVRLRGAQTVAVRRAPARAFGSMRLVPVRVVELLKQIDEDTMAVQLAAGLARTIDDESQIAALAAIMRREKDAGASLMIGKLASYRGIELDDVAFPDFGIPKYLPLANSVAKPLVYSIARQESAFRAKAVSHAGAKGLMQMLTSTARRTAQRKGIAFDPQRLISDPAFNAQLGAAHLGELKDEHPGSMILVFAAYNAGGPRVNQWIKAYGDPRKPGVDPIDWVERIPISETRNYVQRVTENLGVYRSLLGSQDAPYPPVEDLRAYAARF